MYVISFTRKGQYSKCYNSILYFVCHYVYTFCPHMNWILFLFCCQLFTNKYWVLNYLLRCCKQILVNDPPISHYKHHRRLSSHKAKCMNLQHTCPILTTCCTKRALTSYVLRVIYAHHQRHPLHINCVLKWVSLLACYT